MAIRVTCEECSQSIKVAEELAGRRVKCRCGAKIDVPAESDDEPELRGLPPRRAAASRKPRGQSGPAFRVNLSPQFFKNLVRLAVAAVVCVVGFYVIRFGTDVATMAISTKK